jgi:hypothetical protein
MAENTPPAKYTGSLLGLSKAFVDFYKSDTNLQKAYEAFIAGNFTDFETFFLGSDFYKNNKGTAQERLRAKAEQPGAYTKLLDAYKISTRKRLAKRGVKLDDAYLNSAEFESTFLNGIGDDEFDQVIIDGGKVGDIVGGDVAGDIQSLKEYANSFGVGTLQNWKADSANLFAGITTMEEIQAKIRMDAISAYPAYASYFEKGITLDAVASAYKSAFSSILEVDADTVSYENPVMQKALSYKNEKGEPTAMPIWLFKKELKKQPEWAMTDNARDTLDSKVTRVFSDMGLM